MFKCSLTTWRARIIPRRDYSDHPQAVQFPQAPRPSLLSSDYYNSFAYFPPPVDQHYAGSQSSSPTPERNHGYHGREAQIFSDSGGTRRSYSAIIESLLLINSWPTPTAPCEPDVRRYTDASVPHPAGRVGSEKTTEVSTGSPPANGVGPQTPKKRKRITTTDAMRKMERARRGGSQLSQRLDLRGPTQDNSDPLE